MLNKYYNISNVMSLEALTCKILGSCKFGNIWNVKDFSEVCLYLKRPAGTYCVVVSSVVMVVVGGPAIVF